SNFVLGFKWDDLSGNGYSLDPSFVVDDIILKGCPAEGDNASTDVEEGIYEWIPDGDTETILSVENTLLCAQYQWEQSIDLGDTWNDIPGATDSSYTTPSDLTQETWYRVKVYFSTGCPGVYQEEPFKILLGDCSLETIWNGTAWSNGVPDSNSYKIVFEGDYTSSSDANYPTATGLVGCSVEVRDDSEVVISAGHSVTIDNELIIDNANGASFTLKSDANLLQINPDVENEGEIIVEREATVPSIQYNYWASPV